MLQPQPIMIHTRVCFEHDIPLVHVSIADQPPLMLTIDSVRVVAALLAAAADHADAHVAARQQN